MGIYEDDEIVDGGVKELASNLYLSEDDLLKGLVAFFLDDEYENASTDDKAYYQKNMDFLLELANDSDDVSLYSICVFGVIKAYELNGKMGEAKEGLDKAKDLMKTLSNEYSDYEHYPALKGFYTTTSAYYEFCSNPKGSFETLKTTLEDYRNKEREYKSNLDFIFED